MENRYNELLNQMKDAVSEYELDYNFEEGAKDSLNRDGFVEMMIQILEKIEYSHIDINIEDNGGDWWATVKTYVGIYDKNGNSLHKGTTITLTDSFENEIYNIKTLADFADIIIKYEEEAKLYSIIKDV